MLKFIVTTDVFPTTTGFMFGEWDASEAETWARKELGLPDSEGLRAPGARYGVCYAMEHVDIIWCEHEPFDTQAIGTLTHEILHAVINEAKRLGFKLSMDSSEFYCYMTGYLIEKALENVSKLKGLDKPKKKTAKKKTAARKTTKKVDKG